VTIQAGSIVETLMVLSNTRFIGNGQFCLKICNPEGSNESGYCQHTLDRIGLGYNCPSKYTVGGGTAAGDFEVCDSDNMGVPGVYTDAAGATQSYSQPPESDGPITTVPYQPTTVASSNCQKVTSSAIYTDLVPATSSASPGSASATASGSKSASITGSASSKPTGSAASSSKTGSAAQASATSDNAAASVGVSVVATVFGVIAAVAVLA
jgi:hypothetical protein